MSRKRRTNLPTRADLYNDPNDVKLGTSAPRRHKHKKHYIGAGLVAGTLAVLAGAPKAVNKISTAIQHRQEANARNQVLCEVTKYLDDQQKDFQNYNHPAFLREEFLTFVVEQLKSLGAQPEEHAARQKALGALEAIHSGKEIPNEPLWMDSMKMAKMIYGLTSEINDPRLKWQQAGCPPIPDVPDALENASHHLKSNIQRGGSVSASRDILKYAAASMRDWGKPDNMDAAKHQKLYDKLDEFAKELDKVERGVTDNPSPVR